MKTILVDAINTFVDKKEGIFKEMYELLEKYPNRKIVLSGANDEQIEMFGLKDLPYELFTLKHNPEKTDPAYYEMMLKHFDLEKDEVIYFEHDSEAVESARKAGIFTLLYDQHKKDLVELKAFLDSNL
ncbi:MAG: hypothetical protein Fur003_4480 [Candidatus Dojkabacteria bacterium]